MKPITVTENYLHNCCRALAEALNDIRGEVGVNSEIYRIANDALMCDLPDEELFKYFNE